MSKRKNNKRQPQPQANSGAAKDAAGTPTIQLGNTIQQMMAMDAFQNWMARTGFGTPNLMEGTSYQLTRMTQNYNLMNALYRGSWLARRVVDIIPKDMMKNGWKFLSDIPPEDITKINKLQRNTRLNRALLKGLKWGRLYGGAAGLMIIDGQEDVLSEPLDVNAIMPGDFKGLIVVDRWSGVYPAPEMVTDYSSPEFGMPKYYEFRSPNTQEVLHKIHHSRIIRFTGDDLPDVENQAEMGWGASKIEAVYEELKKRDNASANIALLIFQAHLTIYKIKDYDPFLGSANQGMQNDFHRMMQAQNWLQSSQGRQVIGTDDDFQSIQYTFSGLNEIYESFMMDMSGAAQIPVTKLFGRSPAGMNATGESDMRNYYDVVEDDQEEHLRPALDKLLPVMSMSALGYIPDDLEAEFNPVETPSDKDTADLLKSKADVIAIFHDRGIISDRTALMEAKQMSEGTGLFTNITDEDIAAASDKPAGPELTMSEDDPIEEEDTDNA